MKTRISTRYVHPACLLASCLLLASCGPAASTPTDAPDQPVVTEASAAVEISDANGTSVDFDYTTLAQEVTIETVPAQAPSTDAPYWAYGPEYTLITLQGYPVTNHLLRPQIFIYPVENLASFNEGMAMMADDLQLLLQDQQPGDVIPFLPLFNAAQVIHAQVEFLDFNGGTGVRYLAQFDQGILPINNYELIYTFQGLTSDGKYYIAAVFPVTHPSLPSDDAVNEDLVDDFLGYLAATVATLEQQPGDSFAPDLNVLDTLIHSIEVK